MSNEDTAVSILVVVFASIALFFFGMSVGQTSIERKLCRNEPVELECKQTKTVGGQ